MTRLWCVICSASLFDDRTFPHYIRSVHVLSSNAWHNFLDTLPPEIASRPDREIWKLALNCSYDHNWPTRLRLDPDLPPWGEGKTATNLYSSWGTEAVQLHEMERAAQSAARTEGGFDCVGCNLENQANTQHRQGKPQTGGATDRGNHRQGKPQTGETTDRGSHRQGEPCKEARAGIWCIVVSWCVWVVRWRSWACVICVWWWWQEEMETEPGTVYGDSSSDNQSHQQQVWQVRSLVLISYSSLQASSSPVLRSISSLRLNPSCSRPSC